MRSIRSLGYLDATAAADAIVAELKAIGQSAVVAVADQQGELLLLARLDGAPYLSILIAANKAWTAARERKPSLDVGRASRASGSGFDMGNFGDARYTGFGGGLPCIWGGDVVGAIAVSGLTTEEDIRLARLGLDALGFASD